MTVMTRAFPRVVPGALPMIDAEPEQAPVSETVHGRHRLSTLPWWPFTVLLSAGVLLVCGVMLTAPAAPLEQAAGTGTLVRTFPVTVPVPEVTVDMVVYDDDEDRGEQRCHAWTSFYETGKATCHVHPVEDAPSVSRAEEGSRWWVENVEGPNPK